MNDVVKRAQSLKTAWDASLQAKDTEIEQLKKKHADSLQELRDAFEKVGNKPTLANLKKLYEVVKKVLGAE